MITAGKHEKTIEFSPRNPGEISEIPEISEIRDIPGNFGKSPTFFDGTVIVPFQRNAVVHYYNISIVVNSLRNFYDKRTSTLHTFTAGKN